MGENYTLCGGKKSVTVSQYLHPPLVPSQKPFMTHLSRGNSLVRWPKKKKKKWRGHGGLKEPIFYLDLGLTQNQLQMLARLDFLEVCDNW